LKASLGYNFGPRKMERVDANCTPEKVKKAVVWFAISFNQNPKRALGSLQTPEEASLNSGELLVLVWSGPEDRQGKRHLTVCFGKVVSPVKDGIYMVVDQRVLSNFDGDQSCWIPSHSKHRNSVSVRHGDRVIWQLMNSFTDPRKNKCVAQGNAEQSES
jgi:hypothetical protein